MSTPLSFATRAVHAGERAPHPDYTPVVTPIYPSVAYAYDSMDDVEAVFAGTREGYVYARYGSPTVQAFEVAVADLEGAEAAVAFGSGMAAIHAALLGAGVRAGAAVVSAADVYGATYALQEKLLAEMGARARFVDVADLSAVAAALREERPAALVCEIVSNPLLKVADLPALAALAHEAGAALVVDATFATPYLCRPLELGADYVVHSATKYLAGHGDVLAGVVACSAARALDLSLRQRLLGANLGPQEAWLALRGLKTLPLRMRQQCANAAEVAAFLATWRRSTIPACPATRSTSFAGVSTAAAATAP
jgi:cystathionine gamma-synthase/methionine-gamma-lyase